MNRQDVGQGSSRRWFVRLAMIALLVMGTRASRAGVILDNLDQTTDGWTQGAAVGGAIVTGSTAIQLESVIFPQVQFQPGPGEVFVVAARNADGTVGGFLFGDFTLVHDGSTGLTTATVDTGFRLEANTGYWFVLIGTLDEVGWDYTLSTDYTSALGVTLPESKVAFYYTGGAEGEDVYFNLDEGPQLLRINGTAVPEPATVAMMVIAGGVIGLVRRWGKAEAGRSA